MSEDEEYDKYMKKEADWDGYVKRNHNKGENSKIALILKRLDKIETLLLKLTRTPKPSIDSSGNIIFRG